jgi:hypothetical protein
MVQGCPSLSELKLPYYIQPDIEHAAAVFNVFSAGFWSCFDPMPPFCVPSPPFWNGNNHFVPLYVGNIQLDFNFYRGSQQSSS